MKLSAYGQDRRCGSILEKREAWPSGEVLVRKRRGRRSEVAASESSMANPFENRTEDSLSPNIGGVSERQLPYPRQ